MVIDWIARHAARPPRAVTFLSTISVADNLGRLAGTGAAGAAGCGGTAGAGAVASRTTLMANASGAYAQIARVSARPHASESFDIGASALMGRVGICQRRLRFATQPSVRERGMSQSPGRRAAL